jgi:hypothetical protein
MSSLAENGLRTTLIGGASLVLASHEGLGHSPGPVSGSGEPLRLRRGGGYQGTS